MSCSRDVRKHGVFLLLRAEEAREPGPPTPTKSKVVSAGTPGHSRPGVTTELTGGLGVLWRGSPWWSPWATAPCPLPQGAEQIGPLPECVPGQRSGSSSLSEGRYSLVTSR